MKKTKWLPFFCAIITIFLSFHYVAFSNESILIYSGDSFEQMFQFYLGGWQRYRDLAVTQWDWSLGLGGSFFSYAYYFATSPFFLLSLFFEQDLLKYCIYYFTLLKLFVLFIGTYYWLGKLTENTISRFIGGLIFTFSGWVFFFLTYNWFLDAFIFYPFILGAIEEYFSSKKIAKLTILIGFLGIVNYYFLYMFIPFMCMYALFRYLLRNKKCLSVKGICIEALKFVGVVFLGIAISALVLLPCANIVLGNNRFAGTSYHSILLGKKDIFKIISSLFFPVTYRFNCNVLIDVTNHNSLGWGGGTSIYSSLLTPICIFLLFGIKDRFDKVTYIAFYVLLGTMMCLFPFYKLFQMTIDSRWFYMLIFLNVMTVVYVLDQLRNRNLLVKYLNVSSVLTFILLFGLVGVSKMLSLSYETKWIFPTLVVACILMVIYWFSLAHIKKYPLLLAGVLMIECIWSGFVYYKNNTPLSAEIFERDEFSGNAIEYIKSIEQENGFYRVLQINDVSFDDGIVIFSYNEPFTHNYAGASFYSTVYSTEGNGFSNRLKGTWYMKVNEGKFETYNLLSVKYLYTYLDLELYQVPYGFKEIFATDEFTVYENQYYVELGYTYDKTVSQDEVVNADVLFQDTVFLDYLVTDKSENLLSEMGYNSPLTLIGTFPTWTMNTIEFDEPVDDQIIYIMNFGNDNLIIRMYSEGLCVFEEEYFQFGYASVPISKEMGVDCIEFQSDDLNYQGNDIYVYQKDLQHYESWFKGASNRSFYNVTLGADTLSAEISIVGDYTHVYTSVPYNSGWRVFCDGNEIDVYCAQLGMIGFDLTEGTHVIEFKYHTPWLNAGIAISLISLIFVLCLDLRQGRKNSLNH